MLLYELDHARVNLLPHLARHHGFERRARQFDRQITRTDVSRIDDRAESVGAGSIRADKEPSDAIDRALRRAETNALDSLPGKGVEPCQ